MLIMWWIVGRITVGSFDNNKITFRNRYLQLGGDFFMPKIFNKEEKSLKRQKNMICQLKRTGGKVPKRSRLFMAQERSRRVGANMEVKINKEVRNYTESMFLGLSMRQFIFLSACSVAFEQTMLIPMAGNGLDKYRNYMGTLPTLQDFREKLLKQNEPEAQKIALVIELFTNGSLNTFAKDTNVDTKSRLICYDILDLGKQLQPIGMLVVLDSILNRITQNRAKGRT